MSNYQRPQPNRQLVWAVYPSGTHLDRSRASSGGMRATARNDRDNSLVTQAELFDADDRYDDGYRDGLRNLLCEATHRSTPWPRKRRAMPSGGDRCSPISTAGYARAASGQGG